jgi:hypothetical protein
VQLTTEMGTLRQAFAHKTSSSAGGAARRLRHPQQPRLAVHSLLIEHANRPHSEISNVV